MAGTTIAMLPPSIQNDSTEINPRNLCNICGENFFCGE